MHSWRSAPVSASSSATSNSICVGSACAPESMPACCRCRSSVSHSKRSSCSLRPGVRGNPSCLRTRVGDVSSRIRSSCACRCACSRARLTSSCTAASAASFCCSARAFASVASLAASASSSCASSSAWSAACCRRSAASLSRVCCASCSWASQCSSASMSSICCCSALLGCCSSWTSERSCSFSFSKPRFSSTSSARCLINA
mmetsp:Transcript_43286/g.97801  ORF Transcript_43286/g.97801 Transcript_43286/m.97801 type:complete len:202 (-) Transcript_43286:654-1259(-)